MMPQRQDIKDGFLFSVFGKKLLALPRSYRYDIHHRNVGCALRTIFL
jgi:hypothetical protein